MLSKQYVSASWPLTCAVLCVLMFATSAAADVVVAKNNTTYGKITETKDDAVYIARQCNLGDIKKIPMNEVRYIEFSSNCNIYNVPHPGAQGCESMKKPDFYKVDYVGLSGSTYAMNVSLGSDKNIRLKLVENWGTLQGTSEIVKSITPVCLGAGMEADAAYQFTAPQTYKLMIKAPG